jgi:hypothetical protein
MAFFKPYYRIFPTPGAQLQRWGAARADYYGRCGAH